MEPVKMLNELTQTAMKSITVSDLSTSVLQPQYFNQFVQEATTQQTILSEARRIIMAAQVTKIDRTGFSERLMEEATEATAPDGTGPAFHQETLTAKEFIGMSGITDSALRRNIETKNFGSTLISMMSSKWGEDWEALAVFGDTTKYSEGNLLKAQDGWIKKATNKLYGTGNGKDYDASQDDVTDILSLMLKKYPKNYLKNRTNLRFYLDSEMFDAYIDEVGVRPTLAGDEAISKFIARPFKGVPVVEAPVLNDAEGTAADGYGQVAMLQDPNNMVYGVFEQITMEPDRNPKLRTTDYVLTAETDQTYENPNVAVIACNELTKS